MSSRFHPRPIEPSAAAKWMWRSVNALTGAPGPYCIAAFHRVWDETQDELSYSTAAFAGLCRYWREHFEILPLDQLLARLAHGDAARTPALTITFDDGYADNFTQAAPILDRLGLNATFFLTTGAVGAARRFPWDRDLPLTPPMMTWHQIRELHRAGFGIGSHTVSHARLSTLRGGQLDYELIASRLHLEEELGEPILDFAFPFGQPADCDDLAHNAIAAAGYRCCLACAGGLVAPTDSPQHLHRISISPRWHSTPKAWARFYARQRFEHRWVRRASTPVTPRHSRTAA